MYNRRNRSHTAPQVGPYSCSEPCRDHLVHLRSPAKFTLATLFPFSAPRGGTHKGGLASPPESKASLLEAHPTDASSLPLFSAHQGPRHLPPVDDPWACQTGTPNSFFHLENGVWPWRHCLKINHVNYRSKSHMQYAWEQTLKTWEFAVFQRTLRAHCHQLCSS